MLDQTLPKCSRKIGFFQALHLFFRASFVFAPFCAMEGVPAVLTYARWRGRLTGLLRLRGKY